jgi:very-short-patch-repair endonuclease
MTHHEEARRLSTVQHGLVATFQLHDLGISLDGVRTRDWQAEWDRITRRVLRSKSAPRTDGQRAMAAVLDASPGAWMRATSALAWWGVPGFDLEPLLVARPRGITRRPSPLARVSEVVGHLPHHVKVFDGIPVSAPAVALFEACGLGLHPMKMARACDNAWSMGLFNGATIHRTFLELTGSGRNGSTLMRELLRTRPVDYIPPASNLERRLIEIVREAGLPEMRRQVDVGDDDHWVGRIDFLDPDLPVITEVNSSRYHGGLSNEADDAVRYAALSAAGFEVVVVWEDEIWYEKRKVVVRIQRARRAALSRLSPARSA